MTVNCKKYFSTNEEWEAFYERWKSLHRASTSELLQESFNALSDDYLEVDVRICNYLDELWSKRRKWAKCYTNNFLHFDNTTTSRGEGAHHQVKQELQFSTGDLHTVVHMKLSKFLKGQYHNYVQQLEEAKARLPIRLRGVPIFRDITAWVTSFALLKIHDQYKRLACEATAISKCTGTFTRTMGLPCAHKIQERWYDRAGGDVLKLEDMHPHWRFIKPSSQAQVHEEETVSETMPKTPPGTPPPFTAVTAYPGDPQPINGLLSVAEPSVVKAKDRPRDALNKEWTGAPQRLSASQRQHQQALENSTQRDPSAFEYASELPSMQVPNSQASQRDGGRGGRRGRGERDGRG